MTRDGRETFVLGVDSSRIHHREYVMYIYMIYRLADFQSNFRVEGQLNKYT